MSTIVFLGSISTVRRLHNIKATNFSVIVSYSSALLKVIVKSACVGVPWFFPYSTVLTTKKDSLTLCFPNFVPLMLTLLTQHVPHQIFTSHSWHPKPFPLVLNFYHRHHYLLFLGGWYDNLKLWYHYLLQSLKYKHIPFPTV